MLIRQLKKQPVFQLLSLRAVFLLLIWSLPPTPPLKLPPINLFPHKANGSWTKENISFQPHRPILFYCHFITSSTQVTSRQPASQNLSFPFHHGNLSSRKSLLSVPSAILLLLRDCSGPLPSLHIKLRDLPLPRTAKLTLLTCPKSGNQNTSWSRQTLSLDGQRPFPQGLRRPLLSFLPFCQT